MNKKYDQPLTLHRGEKEIKMDYLNNVWELENNYEKDAEELEKECQKQDEKDFNAWASTIHVMKHPYPKYTKEDQLALKIKLYFADYFFYGLFILACGIALGLMVSQF